MSQNSQNNQGQEIDLSVISKKISGFFNGISTAIFDGILFIKRNLIVFFILGIIGIIAGYFLDKGPKTYKNEIVVLPNFQSVDYLYSKIDLLEAKIIERDTIFLKSIGIQNPKKIQKIEIEPIVDIYSFVNDKGNTTSNAQNTQNFELVKLLSESGDINKVIKEKTTSKNYTKHTITIYTQGFTSNEKTATPILNYLNSSEYFNSVKNLYSDNIAIKIKEDQIAINQIDGLLNQFVSTTNNNQKNDKLVYYNDNNQLNDIINNKYNLINEIANLKIETVNFSKTIKDISRVLNIKESQSIFIKMKLILPLILIFGFIFFSIFKSYYNKQMQKLQ